MVESCAGGLQILVRKVQFIRLAVRWLYISESLGFNLIALPFPRSSGCGASQCVACSVSFSFGDSRDSPKKGPKSQKKICFHVFLFDAQHRSLSQKKNGKKHTHTDTSRRKMALEVTFPGQLSIFVWIIIDLRDFENSA